ncbi:MULTISPECIES: hypothetical protein [Oceanimonas]|uniref:Phosphate starvation-inducible protein PsiF n=1 Tax=Oceanimonas doudoroffii TaxID=84158 RepID=A0A233RH30_9GAMM|nr:MULTISPECIES: hypothetical protein [Oceanimonas]NHI00722.1 hypothetical protein [Oceanimonas sp. MB9]OXY82694.1 hypothetical protein B6S08_04040 [Oceanimonas doudoroffii]
MKTFTSVMLAAVFALSMVPLHTSATMASQPFADNLASRGDGIDNRKCMIMKKQGKKLPGFCQP